ncbi:MAG TPA: outer membrane beta-barrel protein [Bacillota bacterium]|nr:outer membrane beta-barrel protein [Bacillota bacterium]
MNSLLKKSGLIIVFAVCLCLLMATVVSAEAEERYYLRLQGAQSNISGDFDGKTGGKFIDKETIMVAAPDMDNDTGYGIVFGAEKDRLCGEFNYLTGKHDSKVHGTSGSYDIGQTTLERFGFDVKYAFIDPANSKIVPFGLLGISRDSFLVENGAVNTASTPSIEGKAKYQGWGYKIGAGVVFRLHDKLALEGSYTISKTSLDRVKAFNETRDPGYKVNCQTIAVSLNYYF